MTDILKAKCMAHKPFYPLHYPIHVPPSANISFAAMSTDKLCSTMKNLP
jgi:hypothetical protein